MMRKIAIVSLLAAGSAFAASIAIGGDPRVDPSRFRITEFATGLNSPYGMQMLGDGSLLVGVSQGFFGTPGNLVRFTDTNHDGVADGPGTVVFSNLPRITTSVRRAGDLVLTMSDNGGQPVISVLRPGADPSATYTSLGTIQLTMTAGWWHTAYTMAVRDTPGLPGSYDVFFNVGSQNNIAPSTGTVTTSGLISGALQGDSIFKFSVSNTAGTPSFSGYTQIARGLRNAAGIVVQPGTGDLIFTDNGIDGLVNFNEPLSADELNRIAAADIGGPVDDFGFPDDYVTYRTGAIMGGSHIQPLVAFQPLGDPQTGSESEGPAEIALAPTGFPGGLNNGIFVGFHGRGSMAGLENEENPVVYYDLTTGEYFHFIDNNQPVGHIDSLLATSDSLFLADYSSTGSGTPGTGVIYQIQALPVLTPEPGARGLAFVGLAALGWGWLRGKRVRVPDGPGGIWGQPRAGA